MREIVIIIPYLGEGYRFFEVFDSLPLNKVLTKLDENNIRITIFDFNKNSNANFESVAQLIVKVTKYLSVQQERVFDYLQGSDDGELRRILGHVAYRLKLKNKQTILFYKPEYKQDIYTYLAILREIKNLYKDITIICAGNYFFTNENYVLKKFEFIDCILDMISGDAVAKLMTFNDIKEISGIIYRKNNKVVRNKPYEFDINNELFPSQFYVLRNPGILSIEYATGCPLSCFFLCK